jgi:hypothetical protein
MGARQGRTADGGMEATVTDLATLGSQGERSSRDASIAFSHRLVHHSLTLSLVHHLLFSSSLDALSFLLSILFYSIRMWMTIDS